MQKRFPTALICSKLLHPSTQTKRTFTTMSATNPPSSTSASLETALKSLHTIYTDKLGEKLKVFEAQAEGPPVPLNCPYVIRIDGVAFSTFTRGLVKPFDSRLKDAMVATTCDLVKRFNPVLAYHHSDEISLVYKSAEEQDEQEEPKDEDKQDIKPEDIKPEDEDKQDIKYSNKKKKQKQVDRTHMYNGRVQKLASVVASYAAARLNFHLGQHTWDDVASGVAARMTGHEAFFDGRVVPLPSLATCADCLLWRANFDGFRNAVASAAQAHFPPGILHGKSVVQLIHLLDTERGIDVMRLYGPKYLFGTWVKKESFSVDASLVMEHLPESARKRMSPGALVVRKRVRTGSFNWAEYSEQQRTDFLAAKFWTDDPGFPPKDPLSSSESNQPFAN